MSFLQVLSLRPRALLVLDTTSDAPRKPGVEEHSTDASACCPVILSIPCSMNAAE